MLSYSYIVLGAGRQGTAAAYDLVRFGDAARVTLADVDLGTARTAADRVMRLTGRTIVEAAQIDVGDSSAIKLAFEGHDVALSAVPYYYNLSLTRAAIERGVSFCDLGGTPNRTTGSDQVDLLLPSLWPRKRKTHTDQLI